MSWTNDPELQEMFRSELGERSARLAEGARAMQQDNADAELAGHMLREGHTIKGTSRVMGYEALSRAGEIVEELWRAVESGEAGGSREVGIALEAVATAIPDAVNGDSVEGTPGLQAAMEQLTQSIGPSSQQVEDAAPEQSPDRVGRLPEAGRSTPGGVELAPDATDDDLGGLLGAVEAWATGQTMPVNTGRLYRLINRIADVRNEFDAVREQFAHDERTGSVLAALDGDIATLQHDALALAAVPLTGMTNTLPQLVRYLARKLDKEVRFEAVGDDGLVVDRQVIDLISDPVRQLIVNAVRHGIEPPTVRSTTGKPSTGSVSMTASIKERTLELVIADDGAGIDWEAVRVKAVDEGRLSESDGTDEEKLRAALFADGFSTVVPNELGGRGAGLSTVAAAVEQLLGRVKLDSIPGIGTTVTLTVPTSVALQRVVVIEEGGRTWGLPEVVVDEVVPIGGAAISDGPAGPALEWHGRSVPLVVAFGRLVGSGVSDTADRVVIVSHRLGEVAFTVDGVLGMREVAVKELGPLLSGPSRVSGAALLGGGDVVLVLDAAAIFDTGADGAASAPAPAARILVVDDSQGARAVVSGALASSGFETAMASSVAEALHVLDADGADAVVVDFSMPHDDGVALVDRIRAEYADLPVVMISAVATIEDQERAERAGVDAYFEKADFRQGALAEALRAMIEERSR